MAASRDQAARVLRSEPASAEGETVEQASVALGEALRSHVAEETKRRPAEAPADPSPPEAPPAAAPPDGVAAKPKSGRRRLVLFGVITLLALAGIAYGVNYWLVGRFLVSTDDAYVRANNTMLGSRVSGHVAAILPRDNALVHSGDVILRIDDGDYRIAVDAARGKIATQQATIERLGRQVDRA